MGDSSYVPWARPALIEVSMNSGHTHLFLQRYELDPLSTTLGTALVGVCYRAQDQLSVQNMTSA